MRDTDYLRHELKGLLFRWGDWHEIERSNTGMPRAWATGNIPGTGKLGHRVLCREMPEKVYRLNQAILTLTDKRQGALRIWYGYQRDEEGRWLTIEKKAEYLGVNYNTLRVTTWKAREELLKKHTIWAIKPLQTNN